MQPDALIMSDPGLIMMVREHFPDMDVHLSVQANASQLGYCEVLEKYGTDSCHFVP
jgi:putative protease